MDYNRFNQIVIEHRNSMISIGIVSLVFVLAALLVVEFYVRRNLECPYFTIGKLRFSPTLLMLIPLIFILIFFPIQIYQCNYDVTYTSYETYNGPVEYSESSIKLIDDDVTIFVGKGHEIVPQGNSYGTVIYSTKSHVVVFYASDDQN